MSSQFRSFRRHINMPLECPLKGFSIEKFVLRRHRYDAWEPKSLFLRRHRYDTREMESLFLRSVITTSIVTCKVFQLSHDTKKLAYQHTAIPVLYSATLTAQYTHRLQTGLQHADIVMTTSECVSPTTQSNSSCKGVRRGGKSFLGCSPTSEGGCC